jgi:hypothetical protein
VCGNAYGFDAHAVKTRSEGRMKTPFYFEARQLCSSQVRSCYNLCVESRSKAVIGYGRTAQVFVRYVGESLRLLKSQSQRHQSNRKLYL